MCSRGEVGGGEEGGGDGYSHESMDMAFPFVTAQLQSSSGPRADSSSLVELETDAEGEESAVFDDKQGPPRRSGSPTIREEQQKRQLGAKPPVVSHPRGVSSGGTAGARCLATTGGTTTSASSAEFFAHLRSDNLPVSDLGTSAVHDCGVSGLPLVEQSTAQGLTTRRPGVFGAFDTGFSRGGGSSHSFFDDGLLFDGGDGAWGFNGGGRPRSPFADDIFRWDNDRRARDDNRGGNRARDDNRRGSVRAEPFAPGSDGFAPGSFDFPHMDLDHLFHLGGGIGMGDRDSGDIAVEQRNGGNTGSSWSSSSSYSGRLVCSS